MAQTKSSNNSTKKKTTRKKETDFDKYSNAHTKARKKDTDFNSLLKSEKKREDAFLESEQGKKVRDEITIIGAFLVMLLLILSYFNICGFIGTVLNFVVFGLLGGLGYLFPFIFFGSVIYYKMNTSRMVTSKKITFFSLAIISISAFLHIAFKFVDKGFFKSIGLSYAEKKGGGLLGAILSFPLYTLFGKVAAIIILIVLFLVCFMMLTGTAILSVIEKKSKEEYKEVTRKHKEYKERKVYEQYEANKRILDGEEPLVKPKKRNKTFVDLNPSDNSTYVPKKQSFLDKLKANEGYEGIKKPEAKAFNNLEENKTPVRADNYDSEMVEIVPDEPEVKKVTDSIYKQEMERKFGKSRVDSKEELHINDVEAALSRDEDDDIVVAGNISNDAPVSNVSTSNFGMSAEGKSKHLNDDFLFARGDHRVLEKSDEVKSHSLAGLQNAEESVPSNNDEKIVIVKKKPAKPKPYVKPPLNKLKKPDGMAKGTSESELKATGRKLEETLRTFGVNVKVSNITCGPSVTQFELLPEIGVKVSKITSLADDIKLALAAADIRIEAPIPGKSAVGIEVPNKESSMVYLSQIFGSQEFKDSKASIAFAVGKDISGNIIVGDIKKMPHLLIAGTTGSGKSVCLNTIILSIIYKYSPEDVKLILIDPKMVEFIKYNGIPHLLIPVVNNAKKAAASLNWAVSEMMRRYDSFANVGVRDIESFNDKLKQSTEPLVDKNGNEYEKMSKIVIVIDELADLMMVASKEVEDSICRIAQLARAAGIHLVVATQRPTTDVVTGLIKANIPSRIALKVASGIDSRTMIDQVGAEKLIGYGDMLYFPTGLPKPIRLQGPYVSDEEIEGVVDFLKSNFEANYDSEIESKMESLQTSDSKGASKTVEGDSGSDFDEYIYQSGQFIIQKQKASIGMLQRQFKIGFNRAARIMDQLSEFGVVGPEEGTKPRQILMDLNQFEEMAITNKLK